MTANVLDQVVLTVSVADAWHQLCHEHVLLMDTGLNRDQIEDEQAEVVGNGRLRIFVRDPRDPDSTLLEMVVEPEGWYWKE